MQDKVYSAMLRSTEQPSVTLPGKLGSPSVTLKDDPRADPRMVRILALFGLDGDAPPPPVDYDASNADIISFLSKQEADFAALFGMCDLVQARARVCVCVQVQVTMVRLGHLRCVAGSTHRT